MAQELYRFFNSSQTDLREYDAGDLASLMRTLAADGVAGLGGCLQVTAEGSTMRTRVGYGSALLRGYQFELRDDGAGIRAYTHGASANGSRIDRVVVRLDLKARKLSMEVKTGTAASNPVPPALTRAGEIFEISLAQVNIRQGATALTSADIVDERSDENACGAAVSAALRNGGRYLTAAGILTDEAGVSVQQALSARITDADIDAVMT
ncbi:MAG: hypothetical protein RR975_14730 [Clostridia bacterium]